MTAPEIYRKWMSDYKFEKRITSKEPIEDGDILDWLAEKVANNSFANPIVMRSDCDHDRHYSEIDGFAYCDKCGTPMA